MFNRSVLGHNYQFETCAYIHGKMYAFTCICQYVYMVLIVLLVFVCVRTNEQMGKLINGGSKISLSLSRSFILLFFVLRMFVPIMLLSTQRQSHGLASDRASMCTHIHTYTMTTLLEMAVYDRLPANLTYNTSTTEQKRTA